VKRKTSPILIDETNLIPRGLEELLTGIAGKQFVGKEVTIYLTTMGSIKYTCAASR
jgi:hypothetical protein